MCLQYEVFFLSVRVSAELVSLSWTKGWLSTPTRVKSAKACCNGGYNHFQMTNREECVCVCVWEWERERKKSEEITSLLSREISKPYTGKEEKSNWFFYEKNDSYIWPLFIGYKCNGQIETDEVVWFNKSRKVNIITFMKGKLQDDWKILFRPCDLKHIVAHQKISAWFLDCIIRWRYVVLAWRLHFFAFIVLILLLLWFFCFA